MEIESLLINLKLRESRTRGLNVKSRVERSTRRKINIKLINDYFYV